MSMKNLSLKERVETLEKEINGEKLQHEMIRKANDYRRDYSGYLRNAVITDALRVGKDSDGGYLVPDEMEAGLVEAIKEHNVVRRVANVFTTSKLLKETLAGKTLKGAWVDEGERLSFSDTDFYQVVIDAHKNGCIVRLTDELVEDTDFDIENYIINSVGQDIGKLEEEAFLSGDGDHKPRGVLLDAQVGVETKEINSDIIADLYYSLGQAYRKNAAWIMSKDAVEKVRKIKNYGGRPIWQPALTEGEPDLLFGREVYVANEMPGILPGNCPIAFGDFSFYWIGDRGNRSIKRLNELYADKGMVGYRITHRVDGKLIVPEAVKTLKIVA